MVTISPPRLLQAVGEELAVVWNGGLEAYVKLAEGQSIDVMAKP